LANLRKNRTPNGFAGAGTSTMDTCIVVGAPYLVSRFMKTMCEATFVPREPSWAFRIILSDRADPASFVARGRTEPFSVSRHLEVEQ
jgi:hypothetical protein